MNKEKVKIFLDICDSISKMSKCVSHKVGCIIVKEDRIVSMGYNGTPKGYKNCKDFFPNYDKEKQREEHKIFSDRFELHAEINSFVWAARNGIVLEESILFSSVQPCWQCTKNIIQSGVKIIVYRRKYDRIEDEQELKNFIKENNIGYFYEEEL